MRSTTLALAFVAGALAQENYGSFPPTTTTPAATPSMTMATSSVVATVNPVQTSAAGPALSTVIYSDCTTCGSSPAATGSVSMMPVAYSSSSSVAVVNGTTTTIPCSAAACTGAASETAAPVAPATTKSVCTSKTNGTAAATGPDATEPAATGPAAPSGGSEGPVYTGGAMKVVGVSALLGAVVGLVMLGF